MDEKQENFDIEDIIKKQRDFFKTGKTKDLDFRIMQLQKLKNSINSNETLLLDALKKDLNKSTFEAYTSEVGFALNDIDFMIKNLKSFAKPVKVKTPPAYLGGKSFIISEPYGEALIIGPWNYPFQLIISPLVGSIAGGNCSILKPSRSAPETYKAIEKVISDAFDEDYIYVVKNGSIKSSELLTHRYDFIFFTGGPTVGKLVMEAA
ncbi:MAG TPA: aldehyde dehydrogenase family protein, partial [Clostridiaceae bacterium]|nr:aldehyde dehydrogenase family protein [Clostridiaceae bacterium]